MIWMGLIQGHHRRTRSTLLTLTLSSRPRFRKTLMSKDRCSPRPCRTNSEGSVTTALLLGWATREAALRILRLWVASRTAGNGASLLSCESSATVHPR